MPTVRQLQLFLFFAKIIILVWYFSNQRFMFPANWGIWGGGNADIHSMDTSVPWDEEEEVVETNLQHGYDLSTRVRFENRIGGPTKIFEYFRDHVYMKQCQEENKEYSEAKAKEAWRELSEAKKIAYSDEALVYYFSSDNKHGDYL